MTDPNVAHGIGDTLAWLASRAAHDRWMVGATKDHYLLPIDLINTADHIVASVERRLPWAATVDGPEREAILRFGDVLAAQTPLVDESELSLAEIASISPAWSAIRDAAAECLRDLNFDLEEWEQRNVRSESVALGD
jgi:hypothetical protein